MSPSLAVKGLIKQGCRRKAFLPSLLWDMFADLHLPDPPAPFRSEYRTQPNEAGR